MAVQISKLDIANTSVISPIKFEYKYYHNRSNNYNLTIYERHAESNQYEPKVFVSHLEYRTNYHLDYNYGENQEKSELFIIVKGREINLTVTEFKEQYVDIFASGKFGRLNRKVLNFICSPEFLGELMKYLYYSANRIKTTNCWTLNNFDYHLKLEHNDKMYHTPCETIRLNNSVVIKNKNCNHQHIYYNLFNHSIITPEDIAYTRNYFDVLYKAIMPETRHDYLNLILTYSIGSLFKFEMRHNKFGKVDFPILLITGQKRVGKTYVIDQVLGLFYNNKSDYTKSESDISGSSALTKLDLQYNSVFPMFFDEISDLKSIRPLINHYLTTGYLKDSLGTKFGKGVNHRYLYHTPVFASNAIKLEQYGSDAINDRFVNYNLSILPIVKPSTMQFSDELLTYDRSRVGKVLMNVLHKNYEDIMLYVNKCIETDLNRWIKDIDDMRTVNKLRYFMTCHYILQYLSEETEIFRDCFKFNKISFYKKLLLNDLGHRVITRNNLVQDELITMITKVIKEGGRNYYLNTLFDLPSYRKLYDLGVYEGDTGDGSFINDEFTDTLRLLNYFENELGLIATRDYGKFVVDKKLLLGLSKGLNDNTIMKRDFVDIFSDYLDVGSTGSHNIGSVNCVSVIKNEREYTMLSRKRGHCLRFDLLSFYRDWQNDADIEDGSESADDDEEDTKSSKKSYPDLKTPDILSNF